MAKIQLDEYFNGVRKIFTLPLKFIGTEFQKAVKAVGSTNGKNPLSIFVPCHRVVDSSGKLTGYAGGLEKKEFLLDLEKIHIAD